MRAHRNFYDYLADIFYSFKNEKKDFFDISNIKSKFIGMNNYLKKEITNYYQSFQYIKDLNNSTLKKINVIDDETIMMNNKSNNMKITCDDIILGLYVLLVESHASISLIKLKDSGLYLTLQKSVDTFESIVMNANRFILNEKYNEEFQIMKSTFIDILNNISTNYVEMINSIIKCYFKDSQKNLDNVKKYSIFLIENISKFRLLENEINLDNENINNDIKSNSNSMINNIFDITTRLYQKSVVCLNTASKELLKIKFLEERSKSVKQCAKENNVFIIKEQIVQGLDCIENAIKFLIAYGYNDAENDINKCEDFIKSGKSPKYNNNWSLELLNNANELTKSLNNFKNLMEFEDNMICLDLDLLVNCANNVKTTLTNFIIAYKLRSDIDNDERDKLDVLI